MSAAPDSTPSSEDLSPPSNASSSKCLAASDIAEPPLKKVKKCTAAQLERLAKGREILALKNAERKKQREELKQIEERILAVENENIELKKKVLEEKLRESETSHTKLKKATEPPTEPEIDNTPIQKQTAPVQKKTAPPPYTSKFVFC